MTKKYPSQIVADEFAASLANRTSPLLSARELKTPVNGITGKNLTAINRLILGGRQSDPRWFTENQARTLDYHLKPEAEGRQVVFWEQYQRLKVLDPQSGQPVLDENGQRKYSYKKHERPVMKLYTVYHASQLELENGQTIPAYQPPETKADPVSQIENIVQATGAAVVHDQKGRSFYRAKDDSIHMPPMSDYQTPEGYCSDLIRELARWTRHEDRLNRPCGPFGTEAYAKEELKINLAALAIAQSLGLPYQPGQSSRYVKDWQILVKKYPYLLAQSANEAEAIKDFVLDFGLSQEATVEQETALSAGPELDMGTVISASAQMLTTAYTTAQARSAMEDIRAATEAIIKGPEFKAPGNGFEPKVIRAFDVWADEALNLDGGSNEKFEELCFKIVVLGHLQALRTGNQELRETCHRAIRDYIAAFPEKGLNLDQLTGREAPADMLWGHDVFTDIIYFKNESGNWRVADPLEISGEIIAQAVPMAVINREEVISMAGGSLMKNRRANQINSPGARLIARLADLSAQAKTLEEMKSAAQTTYEVINDIRRNSGLGESFTRHESDYAAQMADLAEFAVLQSRAINEKSLRRVNVSLVAVASAWAKSVGSPEHVSRYEAAMDDSFSAPHFDDLNADNLRGRNVNFAFLRDHPARDRYFERLQKMDWCDYGSVQGRAGDWLCRENPESPWRRPTDDEGRIMKTFKDRFQRQTGRELAIPWAMLPNSLAGGQLLTLDGQANGLVDSYDLRRIKGLSVSDNDLSTLKGLIRESVYRTLEATDKPDLLRNNLASIHFITRDDNISRLSMNHEHPEISEAVAKKFHSVSGTVAALKSDLLDADLPHLQIPVAMAGLGYAELIKDYQLRDSCRDFIRAYGQTFDLESEYAPALAPVTPESFAAAKNESGKVFGLDYLANELVCLENGRWRDITFEEMNELEARQEGPGAIVPLPVLGGHDNLCLTFNGEILTADQVVERANQPSVEIQEKAETVSPNRKETEPSRPVRRGRPEINPLTPEQELALVCERAGLLLGGPPVMDGQKHRAPVVGGKKGALDGEYCAHADGRPNGWVKNYKTDEYQKWIYTGHELSPEQKAEIRRSNSAVRDAREKESQTRRAEGRRLARIQWDRSNEPPQDHPYLAAKGIEAFGVCQAWESGDLIVPGYDILARSETGLKHLDNIQIIQTITPEGEKRFSKDCVLKGAMYIIDPKNALTRDFSRVAPESTWAPLRPESDFREILVAEGFATAATLHMATGQPVAVSFTAANLEPAAKNLKKVFPNIDLSICADNDHRQKKNVGLEKAELAAKAVGGRVVIPEFTEAEKARGLTDFNDLAKSRGLEAVTKIIAAELGRDRSSAQSPSQNTGMSR
jgi:phage/plasmid primase-like uncharacterized protein/antirestriction protein ArdC